MRFYIQSLFIGSAFKNYIVYKQCKNKNSKQFKHLGHPTVTSLRWEVVSTLFTILFPVPGTMSGWYYALKTYFWFNKWMHVLSPLSEQRFCFPSLLKCSLKIPVDNVRQLVTDTEIRNKRTSETSKTNSGTRRIWEVNRKL